MELINLELEIAIKKYSNYLIQASHANIEKPLALYEVMDDLKQSRMLDPRFKLDWCQVVRLSPTTPAEYMELNWNCSIWN